MIATHPMQAMFASKEAAIKQMLLSILLQLAHAMRDGAIATIISQRTPPTMKEGPVASATRVEESSHAAEENVFKQF